MSEHTKAEDGANARLRAAAAELLEACKHVADELESQARCHPKLKGAENYMTRMYVLQLAGVLRAAIAKAEGK